MENKESHMQDKAEARRLRYLKLSPFNTVNSGDYKFAACVGSNGGYNQSTIYEGFKDAVNTLVESIANYENMADPMVYPILFCIRHSMELFLKGLLGNAQYIKCMKNNSHSFNRLLRAGRTKERLLFLHDKYENIVKRHYEDEGESQIKYAKKRKITLEQRAHCVQNLIDFLSDICFEALKKEEYTHDISGLISKITDIYDVDNRLKESFDKVLPLLSFYKDIDANGDAFRYWSDKDGNPHFESHNIGIVRIDILAIQFEEIAKLFGETDMLVWCLIKEYRTGTFTNDLSRTQIRDIAKTLPSPDVFGQQIREVKEQIKKKYNIGSNKFDIVLDIIRKHREFSSYMGVEKKFSRMSKDALRIFAECSQGLHKWEEASSNINSDELNLFFTFSDMCGWRYMDKDYSYFSEDLKSLYELTKRNRRNCWHDINPVVELDYVIKGMEKCGQTTYASILKGFVLELNAQS